MNDSDSERPWRDGGTDSVLPLSPCDRLSWRFKDQSLKCRVHWFKMKSQKGAHPKPIQAQGRAEPSLLPGVLEVALEDSGKPQTGQWFHLCFTDSTPACVTLAQTYQTHQTTCGTDIGHLSVIRTQLSSDWLTDCYGDDTASLFATEEMMFRGTSSNEPVVNWNIPKVCYLSGCLCLYWKGPMLRLLFCFPTQQIL
ncbi:unnamed protein product [Pleuronectes platessa]|uniref:Uncharacterized protein n=1 Tax=Pleuronectes platessa TaxID=8262 RepID=A0A9N7TMP3_PLEPL|nr:unnamed protein product [Pleuronectes platessa]